MGFVSYSEDILKRHQSDIHDLMRELEAGHLSEAQQAHVLPQFEEAVEKLRDILSDPRQPFAMKLLELRNREVNLAFEIKRLETANESLRSKNNDLNERVRWADRDRDTARQELAATKGQCQELKGKIANLRRLLASSEAKISHHSAQMKALEQAAMQAQISRFER